jgi:hypothetical protein
VSNRRLRRGRSRQEIRRLPNPPSPPQPVATSAPAATKAPPAPATRPAAAPRARAPEIPVQATPVLQQQAPCVYKPVMTDEDIARCR